MMNTMGASHFRRNSKTIPMLRLLALLAATLVLAAESGPLLAAFGTEILEEGILINVCAFTSSIKTHRTSLSLLGLVCGIFSSFLAGKYRLKYLDCVCPLLWMLYMGLVYPSSLHWVLEVVLPVGVATNLPLLLSAVLLVACFGHALQARVKPTKKVFANRLPRNLTEFNPHQCQVASSPERHLESHLEPSAAPSTQTDASMSLSHSSSSESGEIRRILLDQSLLGGLSLGPPTGNKPRNKDIWTAHTPPTSRPATPAMSEDRPSSREFRPVISPATFNPSGLKRCSSQNSFATSFAGAFSACAQFEPQPLPLPQEQREPFMFTDSGRGSCVPSLRDDSSDESFPLGMTAKDHINQTTTTSPHTKLKPLLSGWLPFILPCAFGFSLGINFAAAMYVMYGR